MVIDMLKVFQLHVYDLHDPGAIVPFLLHMRL